MEFDYEPILWARIKSMIFPCGVDLIYREDEKVCGVLVPHSAHDF